MSAPSESYMATLTRPNACVAMSVICHSVPTAPARHRQPDAQRELAREELRQRTRSVRAPDADAPALVGPGERVDALDVGLRAERA